LIRHSFEWVEKECHARGLVVRELPDVINGQTWLCIQTPAAAERDAVMMPAAPEPQQRSVIRSVLKRAKLGDDGVVDDIRSAAPGEH